MPRPVLERTGALGDRVLQPISFTNGELQDQMIWISVGELYGRLIAAGALP